MCRSGSQAQNQPTLFEVIESFVSQYQLSECENHIWDILSAAFASENADMWENVKRSDTIYFFKSIHLLLKAAYATNIPNN